MSNQKLKTNNKKIGFTLIELLIVIALLGILAVGLLAAIDPLEQFKKGQDTGTRNAVQELYNGMIRYYAIQTEYPLIGSPGTFDVTTLDSASASDMIDLIVDAGELKSNFLPNIRNKEDVYVYYYDDGDNVEHSVCFKPTSKSIRTDPNTKYDNMGSEMATDVCTGNTNSCYWCLR